MDAFEEVVSLLLERSGFWVRTSYKVKLTKEDKVSIGRSSCPRWEIDVVGYCPRSNEIRIVECKSYLDSTGVQLQSLKGGFGADLYKLFTDAELRAVVTQRLVSEMEAWGGCLPNPKVTYCLAAGKVKSEADRKGLRELFQKNGWVFWDSEWIKEELLKSSMTSYENDAISVVTKLLLR